MSHVSVAPDMVTAAAAELQKIASTLDAAHLATAPTFAVVPAAADEVSASIAHLFSGHGQEYQAVAREAAAYQDQFVENSRTGAVSYASAEAVSASLLQALNSSARSLFAALGSQAVIVLYPVLDIWQQEFVALIPPEILVGVFILLFVSLAILAVSISAIGGGIAEVLGWI